MKKRQDILLWRIRLLTSFFMVALVISGLTAIPLQWELDVIAKLFGAANVSPDQASSGFVKWILKVREALHETNTKFPFLAYGTDWLAFGHIAIAIAFVGALRNPVRNIWLFNFGMIACVLIVPWAFIFGGLRGIPVYWRLIDCSFGIFGIVPLWFCKRWTTELSQLEPGVRF
ncbi:MAG: hypothetical protein ABIR24_08940 [Verrucomicrobiota bacterium]